MTLQYKVFQTPRGEGVSKGYVAPALFENLMNTVLGDAQAFAQNQGTQNVENIAHSFFISHETLYAFATVWYWQTSG